MKLTNEICVSFLNGSGWLQNHDKKIREAARAEAINDFSFRIKEELEISLICNRDRVDTIAEQIFDNLSLRDSQNKRDRKNT